MFCCRGRQLDPATVLDPQQLGSAPLVVVRVQLLAEGELGMWDCGGLVLG
jgi:hypothetical protein